MRSIGQTLADARRQRKVTVKDAEKAIKIRAKHISALEGDTFNKISGEAYIIGFLKTYAQWLDLDPKPLIKRYREEAESTSKTARSVSIPVEREKISGPIIKKLLPRVILLIIAIVLAIRLMMALWSWLSIGS